jgi:hypothetical protein
MRKNYRHAFNYKLFFLLKDENLIFKFKLMSVKVRTLELLKVILF